MNHPLVVSATLAGAMLLQTKDVLSGKDPRAMMDENAPMFWMAALFRGGGLGLYGDALYSLVRSYDPGQFLNAMAGPTIGPLIELAAINPARAAFAAYEGRERGFRALAARELETLRTFLPGDNIWYAKTALDHLIWQQVLEMISPGYLASMRKRARREKNQEWWWGPGELTPDRTPDLEAAVR